MTRKAGFACPFEQGEPEWAGVCVLWSHIVAQIRIRRNGTDVLVYKSPVAVWPTLGYIGVIGRTGATNYRRCGFVIVGRAGSRKIHTLTPKS